VTTPTTLPRAWLTVALLWPVAFINFVDRTMVTTMHTSLVTAIHLTEAQFGLLTSVFLWTYGIMIPLAGFLADRFNRRGVIIGSLIAWSATTCLTAYIQTFPQLLVMRVLLGVAESCYIPAALAMISDYHPGPTRTFAMGVHQTGIVTGMMLGGLGGWIAESHSWRTAFTVLGLPGLIYGVLLLALLREAPKSAPAAGQATEPPARFGAALAGLLGQRAFLLELAAVVVLGAGGWIIVGWLPTYIGERFNLSQGAAGFSATAYLNGATGVGFILGGMWTSAWARTNIRSHIFVPVIGLCIAIPAMLFAANAATLVGAISWLVVFGISRTCFDVNLVPILCLVCDPRYRATGVGIISACSTFTGGFMIYFVGILRDHQVQLGSIFNYMAVSLAICVALLLLIRIPKAPAMQAPEPAAAG
jgi:MFS family permease